MFGFHYRLERNSIALVLGMAWYRLKDALA